MEIRLTTLSENTANYGFHASARLAQGFEDVFFLNNAGTRLALP
jgi:hypothetical protein